MVEWKVLCTSDLGCSRCRGFLELTECTALLAQLSEIATFLADEIVRSSGLHQLAAIQDQDTIKIDDCLESMGNSDEQGVLKFLSNRCLYLSVALEVLKVAA